jgi:hypothetical protein
MHATVADKIGAALNSLEVGIQELRDRRSEGVPSLLTVSYQAINDLRLVLDDLEEALKQADYAVVGGLN